MFKGFKKNDKYFTIAVYAFLVIAASIGLICVITKFSAITGWLGGIISAMSSFIYGFVIAYICNAIYKKVHKYVFKFVEKNNAHPKLRKCLSLILSYIIFVAIIVLFLWAIIPSLISSITSLINDRETFVDNLIKTLSDILKPIPFVNSGSLEESIRNFFSVDGNSGIFTKALEIVKANLLKIATVSAQVVMNLIVGFILSVYFLIYKEKMTAKIKRILCAFFKEDKYKGVIDFARYSDRLFGRYMLGTLVDSFFVGVIMFFILWICKFPLPALIAVTCGVTNIIPFFGPFIGAIPSALLILITSESSGGGLLKVLIFAVIVLVLQQIDGNIIAPNIHGATTGMTPIGVIAAVTLSSHLFGFIGMVIGVPLCAVIFYYMSKFVDKKLKKKHMPTQPEYYRVADIFDDENFAKARSALEAEAQLENSETLATAAISDEVLKEIKEQVVGKLLSEALDGINEAADAREKEING